MWKRFDGAHRLRPDDARILVALIGAVVQGCATTAGHPDGDPWEASIEALSRSTIRSTGTPRTRLQGYVDGDADPSCGAGRDTS